MNIFTKLNTGLTKSLLGLLLVWSTSANAQVLVNESFNTGSDYTPPAGWTNVSNNPGIDPWDFSDQCLYFNDWFDAGSTTMSGNIAIINTDCTADDANTDLTSPAFDASVAGTYLLEFDNSIKNFSSQLCQVDAWNGNAWVNVMTVDGINDGAGSANHKNIDITAATGGFNQSKIRFHYEGDWEYWWAIDNVKITRVNCTSPVVAFSVIPDCVNNQFSVNAAVTNMGSATSLSLSNGVTTYGSPIIIAGAYVAGPFASGVPQTITLVHNNDVLCNVSQAMTFNCDLPNDFCAYAVPLIPSASCIPVASTTAGATISDPAVVADCIDSEAGNDVWFSFVATSTATSLQVTDLQPSNPAVENGEVGFSIYNAACENLSSPVACSFSYYYGSSVVDDALSLTGLTIGQTYLIRVHSDYASDINYDPVASDFNFNICVKEEYLPANDNCVNAMAIPVGSGLAVTAVVSTTVYSTVENNMQASSCGDELANDIWFKVTVPASGNVTIQSAAVSADAGTDVVMEAYTGTCGNLTSIACDDDGNPDAFPSSAHSRIVLTGQTPGAIIYIRITPYDEGEYGPVAMTAWDPVLPVIATAGICDAATAVTIDSVSGNLYRWVPILNATGQIIAEVYPNGETLGIVNAGLFINSGAVRQANGVYYLDRNISITPSSQPGINGTVRVRLYVLSSELAALTNMDPTVTSFGSLNISKSQEGCQSAVNAATQQINQSGNQAFTDGASNNGCYIECNVSSFSSFYLRGGSVPLPIELKSITAKNTGASNRIDWTTVSETSTDYFELERSSDGRIFSYLSKIASNDKPSDYVYYDEAPLAKDNYYRLKLLNKNGRFSYSKTVIAVMPDSKAFALEAYPNPVAEKVLVKVYGSENGSLSISDITGKVILTTVMKGTESDIDLNKIAAGVYFIRYTDGHFSETIKIMKQ